ncbi:MAG: hypothetical protein EOO46_15015 [Flavobacterium sp.]|nr:MAG: hypothetical protein EOO46_15015 [Flavobacterium sp.]
MNYSRNKCWTAYLDILGFKEQLRGKHWEDKVDAIFEIVEKTISESLSNLTDSEHKILPKNEIQSLFISDSIFLWIAVDEKKQHDSIKACRLFLHVIEMIQFRCALENIWLRGGVGYGETIFSSTNIAGHGLLQAVSLEKQAVYPRVLVNASSLYEVAAQYVSNPTSHDVLKEINKTYEYVDYSGRFLFSYSSVDPHKVSRVLSDDYPFIIDYLNRAPANSSEARKILKNIQKNIREVQEISVYQKYRWLSDYLENSQSIF